MKKIGRGWVRMRVKKINLKLGLFTEEKSKIFCFATKQKSSEENLQRIHIIFLTVYIFHCTKVNKILTNDEYIYT